MSNKNEILFAVREAKGILGADPDFRVKDAFAIFEGIAPFLDKEKIIGMKCECCDNYASASFTLSNDFWIVDKSEYCHSKDASLKNLTALKLASCTQYTRKSQEDLENLAKAIIEEDLKPAFLERKLYDRSLFANYNVDFLLKSGPGKVSIEFGHKTNESFTCSDITLYLLKRLDPGFGAQASQKIAEALKNCLVLVVKASPGMRKQQDIDYVLEWIAKKRKMDIVYL
jgi:hypothetical protein